MQVTSKRKLEDGSKADHTVEYDFGGSLAEAIDKFGEETVFNQYTKKSKIDLQTMIGGHLIAGKSAEDIDALVAEWEPSGEIKTKKSPKAKIVEAYDKMSAEERQALLDKLLAMQNG